MQNFTATQFSGGLFSFWKLSVLLENSYSRIKPRSPLQRRKVGLEIGISVLAALALLFQLPQMFFLLKAVRHNFDFVSDLHWNSLFIYNHFFDPALKTDMGPRHVIPSNSCCPPPKDVLLLQHFVSGGEQSLLPADDGGCCSGCYEFPSSLCNSSVLSAGHLAS